MSIQTHADTKGARASVRGKYLIIKNYVVYAWWSGSSGRAPASARKWKAPSSTLSMLWIFSLKLFTFLIRILAD
jgi:hypothetical protein